MAKSKKLRVFGIVVLVLLLGVGATVWAMWPTVDPIPEVLPEIEHPERIADLELEGQGPEPTIRLGELRGKRVFLMIEGRESMSGGEGRDLRRALHRWQLPEDVVGFAVGDAPGGAAMMKRKIEREFVGPMREEMKWPVYVDFGGNFTDTFELPRGHFGLVVLDADGDVVFRHAGDADAAKVEEIKAVLDAREPEPGPAAPDFAVGGVTNEACRPRGCVLVFLTRKVARKEIPGLERGGFEGEMDEAFQQIKKPSVRLARILAADWEADQREGLAGVIVGEGAGWSVEGWPFVAIDAPGVAEAREAFDLGDEAALVIIDGEGRTAFVERGRIPFWKLTVAADILDIKPKEYRHKD